MISEKALILTILNLKEIQNINMLTYMVLCRSCSIISAYENPICRVFATAMLQFLFRLVGLGRIHNNCNIPFVKKQNMNLIS